GDDGEADRLAPLFGHGKRLGEELLLDAAEKLVGLEFVFARSRAAQEPDMEHDNVAATGLDAVQHVSEMIERVLVAYGNKNIAGARTHGLGSQFRRSEEHTSELQSLRHLVCRLLLEKKNT